MIRKKLMVVAGGDWQVPMVRKAKSMGLFVLNTNLYADSPGFRFADAHLIADVLDQEAHLDCARNYRPDGIVTDQSDIAVPTVAYLCQNLGLAGIGQEAAALFTNKFLMRTFLQKHGYPTPDFELCRSPASAIRFANQQTYPVVIKPLANQSSRGVFKVMDEIELCRRYEDTLLFSRDGLVLVEEFISGTELTVEGIKTHGRHYTLAISRKQHFGHNPMVASELFYSPAFSDMNLDLLKQQHDALIEDMGLVFGLTHAEYIHADGRFFLVEVAARGGGTRISSDIVPAVSGVQTNELLVRMALGEPVQTIAAPSAACPFAMLGFFNFEGGRVEDVSGIEAARSLPGVLEVATNFKTGDLLEPPRDDRSRHGFFIAVSNSEQAMQSLNNQVRSLVRVVYA